MSLTRELFHATAKARCTICGTCGRKLAGCDQEAALEAGEKVEAMLREEIAKLVATVKAQQVELNRKP